MIETFSQVEAAFRTMLVHKAEGAQHDAIARLHSIPRPAAIPEDDWVNAIHVLAYGPRGHPGGMFRFVEMALKSYDTEAEIEVKLLPYRLFDHDGGVLDETWVDRLVRVNGGLYRVESYDPGGSTPWVDLYRFGTTYWQAPALPPMIQAVRRLPFRVREATGGPILELNTEAVVGRSRGTGVTFEVLLAPELQNVPRTYLRVNGAARTSDPFGGHLLTDASVHRQAVAGVCPLYLDNGRRMREFEVVLDDMLASGVKAVIKMDGDIW
jgi:hypothetical protein